MRKTSRFINRYTFVKGNFLILIITWILMNFAGPIPQTYANLYYKSLGADDFVLGVIGFAGSFALALVQFPGGYLADKHGRRWLIITMTYGVALSFVFFVFAPSWHFIVLGLIMQNLCLLYQPALFAIMLDSVPPERRGVGYTLQAVITNLVSWPGFIIAGYLLLIFDLDFSVRVAYTVALAAYFIAATLRIKLKETLPLNNGNDHPNFIDALREYPKSVREGLDVWKKVPKQAFYLFVAAGGMTGLYAACSTYFLIYADEVLNIDRFQWAVVMAFMSLTIAAPTILAGIRMDVVGRKRFLILGFLLYIPAVLLFLRANFAMLLTAFFFFGLGQVLQSSSYQSLLGDLIPRDLRGKAVGCSQFFIYLAQAFIQLLAGALYAFVSPQLPFILFAVSSIPFSLIVIFKIFDPRFREV